MSARWILHGAGYVRAIHSQASMHRQPELVSHPLHIALSRPILRLIMHYVRVDKVGFGCRYPPYKVCLGGLSSRLQRDEVDIPLQSLKPLQALFSSLPPRPAGKRNSSSKRCALWLSAVALAVVAGSLTQKGGFKLIWME